MIWKLNFRKKIYTKLDLLALGLRPRTEIQTICRAMRRIRNEIELKNNNLRLILKMLQKCLFNLIKTQITNVNCVVVFVKLCMIGGLMILCRVKQIKGKSVCVRRLSICLFL